MMKTVVFGGCGSERFAKLLAKRIKASYAPVRTSYFPDGELLLRLPADVRGKHAVLVYSFQPYPGEVLLEALIAIGAAKQQGAKKVTLVAPYLGFMRQDKQFHAGEAVSNSIVARLLSSADMLVTMDPHLHRIKSLNRIFSTKTTTLTANQTLADHLRRNHSDKMVVGPDEESSQWAASVAKLAGLPSIVLKKKRYTATKVRIIVKSKIPLKGKHVVIVDDIISTGHTMIEPIKQLKKLGVKSITCIGVHGVFAGNALQDLKKLAMVETTNTIHNPVARIDVTKAFAETLR
ncbi:ribose-phosphate diphosphokinase [Candidatus Woesearchaeota archaeon]|nr:ribose-phosphate diphosphokinase [Candidatus Woesearchaeota archaeon]